MLIGVYFANKNATLQEYMLGGRDQRLLPVSISMMTSFVSGLTLIGNPAELYHHGITFSFTVLAMVIHVPFSSFILLPVFHRLESISVFKYLELRYSKWVKRIVSLAFIFQMTLYNAVVLYIPSLSLKSVLGISSTVSIGAVGLSCLIYSTLGGIKAVIWTDFFQAGLMYLALISICLAGTAEVGGFKELIRLNKQGNRLSMDEFLNFDLNTRHTIFTVLTGSVIINIFMNGANQIQVQRSLSLPTLRLAQWSQLIAGLFTLLIALIASYVGLIMYATYKDCDPFESKQIDKRDALLIYYISTNLNYLPGLRGVFVAGIFAATLSTLSSFQNSMSALVLEDFVRPVVKLSEKQATILSKTVALLFGLVCICLTFLVGNISGLLQVVLTLFGSLGAPFLSAFFLGMLTRFVNTIGMLTGMTVGFLFAFYVQIYQTFYLPPLKPSLPLSTAGCAAPNSSNLTLTPIQTAIKNEVNHSTSSLAYSILTMSYLWLPLIALILTSSIACIVSKLTGGSQEVDDRFLVKWLHRPKAKRPRPDELDLSLGEQKC